MSKEMKLLTAIGWVKDEYIQEMMEPGRARVPRKKIWLVAAVIATALLLTGCAAVYFMRLENLTLRQEIVMNEAGTTEVRTEISLQGVAGSPNFQAVREWDEFSRNYDTDMAIYQTLSNEEMDQGLEYYSYQCYTREMADKVDEICEKYNLQKQGMPQHEQSWENICHVFQVEDLLRPEADLVLERYEGYIFRSGSFKLEAEANLFPSGNQPILSVTCVAKTDFSTVAVNIGDVEQYQQWNTTTSDGTELLLALGPNGGLILADKADYFYSITVHDYNEYEGDGPKGRLEPAHIQEIADAFDFSLPIHPLSDGEWEYLENNKVVHTFTPPGTYPGGSFDDRVKFQLENKPNPEELEYALADIDGNGTSDLLIGRHGVIRHIYMTDGENTYEKPFNRIARHIKMTDWGEPQFTNASSYIYICEDNKAVYVFEEEDDCTSYMIAETVNGEMDFTVELKMDPTQNTYNKWTLRDGIQEDKQSISKEKFDEILSSCVPIQLDMKPLTEFPLA